MNLASELARGTRRTLDAGSADFERFRGRLDKSLHRARKRAARRIDDTDRYVRKNPWTALAIGVGAAAVLGVATAFLLRSRD